MIITVKNLQQQTFTVDFPAEKTVLELKEQIFKERGPEYVVEKQKLIYAGVILDDERTIASYNVDEKKFVVVMLKRDIAGSAHKPDDTNATLHSAASSGKSEESLEIKQADVSNENPDGKSSSEAATANVPVTIVADEDTKSIGSAGSGGSDSGAGGATLGQVGSNTSIQSNTSGASLLSGSSIGSSGSETSHSTYSSGDLAGVFSNTSLQSRAESSWLTGEEYNQSVDSMIEMGYSRELVERAMAASFNNPERAVEYLISGIPEINEEAFNAVATGNAAEEHNSSDNSGGASGDGEIRIPAGGVGDGNVSVGGIEGAGNARDDPFEFLRNQPQFLQMRSLVYQNPELLQAVLQQIGTTNPALLRLISENQDAFLSMLNQPMAGQGNPQYPRRMTPGRRAQLAAAARAAAGGDGLHVRSLDTAPGAGGDGPPPRQRPGESGDAGADTIPPDQLPPRPDRAAERRAAAVDAFMRERAVAAAAVAALTAAASAAVERDAGGGEGGGGDAGQIPHITSQNLSSAIETGGIGGRDGDGGNNAGDVGAAVSDGISGVATIRLTPQDQDAIERLKALGFPEPLVLQAYFACDKDEQLAANFLISSDFDD